MEIKLSTNIFQSLIEFIKHWSVSRRPVSSLRQPKPGKALPFIIKRCDLNKTKYFRLRLSDNIGERDLRETYDLRTT